MQAIAMDEDAEVEGQMAQTGPKSSGSIPAGAMMASPGDQTNRKMSLEPLAEAKSLGQDPLVPAASGASPQLHCLLTTALHVVYSGVYNSIGVRIWVTENIDHLHCTIVWYQAQP